MNQLVARLKENPRLSLAGIAAVVIAVVLVIVFVVAGVGGDDNDGDSQAGKDNPGVVVNQAGQYSITLPEGYTSSQQGRRTEIKNAEGTATMEISPGRPGVLEDAASVLYQQVGRNYQTKDKTNLPSAVEAKVIGGRKSLLYAGAGTNDKNVAIRFLCITIADQPANWWITIYVPEGSNPDETLPKVTDIVDTFKPF